MQLCFHTTKTLKTKRDGEGDAGCNQEGKWGTLPSSLLIFMQTDSNFWAWIIFHFWELFFPTAWKNWLENALRFGLRYRTLIKSSKFCSWPVDMSHLSCSNWNLMLLFKQIFQLNPTPACRKQNRPSRQITAGKIKRENSLGDLRQSVNLSLVHPIEFKQIADLFKSFKIYC